MTKNIIQTQKRKKITPIKSILAYTYFSYLYILRKKSTWINLILIFAIYIGLISIAAFLMKNLQNSNTEELFLMKTSFLNMFLGLSLPISTSILFAMYSIVKSVNLFKDPSKEGIELLIISKPITRWQIIFVRYLVFVLLYFVVLIISIFAVIIGFLILGWSEFSVALNFGEKIGGLVLSSLISYVLFGAISILISLKFGTVLTTVGSLSILMLGTMISQTIPPILNSISKTRVNKDGLIVLGDNHYNLEFPIKDYEENYYTNQNSQGKKIILNDEAELNRIIEEYNELQNDTWLSTTLVFLNPMSAMQNIFNLRTVDPFVWNANSYSNSNSYSLSPLEWNYSLEKKYINQSFLNSDVNKSILFSIDKYNTSKINYGIDKSIEFNISYHDLDPILSNFYQFVMSVDEIYNNSALLKQKMIEDKLINNISFNINDSQSEISINDLTNEQVNAFFYLIVSQVIFNQYQKSDSNKFEEIKETNFYKDWIKNIPNSETLTHNFLGQSYYKENNYSTSTNSPLVYSSDKKGLGLVVNSKVLPSIAAITITWLSISLLLTAGSIFMYSRKDFS